MRVLAIETSCDETAAAVVADGRQILSNVVASQIELHARFGGVFPEVASRQHVLCIDRVVRQALDQAGLESVSQVNALAVTCGPGLVGSLMVGVNMAKGLHLTSGVPLWGINHLAGHVYSLWLQPGPGEPAPDVQFPLVILIASGGHTDLVLMQGLGQFRLLGSTLDDAAGEAFDKVARILGLGFPGGPAIQTAAAQGQPDRHSLPYPLQHDADHRFDFSFSGLKTFMVHAAQRAGLHLATEEAAGLPQVASDLAAAFQGRVAGVLLDRVADAVQTYNAVGVGLCGGVSANQQLRQEALHRCQELGVALHIPPLYLCTDNAAMIGAAAYFQAQGDPPRTEGLDLDVHARWSLHAAQPGG